MANLFNKNILKKSVENYHIPNQEENLALIKQWLEMYKSGFLGSKTETESEQAFNDSFFVQILGYQAIPNNPFTIDPKGKNQISGQKADAILGYFTTDTEVNNLEKVQAVVEVKDSKTSLDKPQRREGNLSPVQQGFKYKPQYSNCKWVIVSNFYEIRLYKDTMLDFEIWNLENLLNPENDYEIFRTFHYLLSAKNLISGVGESNTERLLSAVRQQQEKITKEFYDKYKKLRFELINDIKKNNPKVSIETVIAKSQKIIDRLVFIFFCEDRDLLPQGKVNQYIEKARELDFTPRELLKRVFRGVDKGSEMLEIPKPGYNGGLFAPDEELEQLEVSDVICHKFLELGKYDFQEEISVNVLGHIFEQSISDLEELKINMLGTELGIGELGEATKHSKRKKDGIFYTPEYIVDYIVRNSLGKYLEEKESELKDKFGLKEDIQDKNYEKRVVEVYREYQKILQHVKVLDPACGSGAFLVKVYDFLYNENKRVIDLLSGGKMGLFDNDKMVKDILQNNIYGVDLNDESVEITKLSLWLKTAEKGKQLADLNNNIKCGNSLIDDESVAGKKAFKRELQFQGIMKNGGFDVIVGNPPYVDIKAMPKSIVDYYFDVFESCHNRINLYSIFIEQGLKLMKDQGKLGFIFPSSLLMNSSYEKLRKILLSKTNIDEIIKLPDNVFEDVKMETMILIFSKGQDKIEKITKIKTYSGDTILYNVDSPNIGIKQIDWNNGGCEFNLNLSDLEGKLISKIETNKNIKSLSDFCEFSLGITPYDKYKGHSEEIIKNKLFHSTSKEDETCKPLISGENIKRYFVSCDYKNFIKYGDWLGATRNEKFFAGEHLVMRQIITNNRLYVCYDKGGFYNTQIGFNIVSKGIDIKYILALLNSTFISWYHSKKFLDMTKTLFQKILIENARKLPIVDISKQDQKSFIEKADKMLELNKQFYEAVDFVLRFFQSKFGIEKVSNKLEKFWELEFPDFLKQLKIKKLGLDQEAELMAFFEKKKSEILAMKNEIDKTDKEIDDMVFDLYGLNDEERKVVLGG